MIEREFIKKMDDSQVQSTICRRKNLRNIQRAFWCFIVAASMSVFLATPVLADETCMSPYMTKITGQEDFVYVWTLGAKGVGDESDKLVTIDVRPGSKTYGKVIHALSGSPLFVGRGSGYQYDLYLRSP
jgi:hypothetical protein